MRAILTVIGKDKPGIIAKLSKVLADENVNIEDITQTVLKNNFTMCVILDLKDCKLTLVELSQKLTETATEIGVSVYLQHEDIYNAIYTI